MSVSKYFVIFGADGMLGRALVANLPAHGCTPFGRSHDITDPHVLAEVASFIVKLKACDVIVVNAAAFTHVDACETDQDKAFRVNALGAELVARSFESCCLVVHVSTGAVFDGVAPGHHDKDGFDEFAPARPLSAYARSKWAGEELVRRTESEALIVRLGHLYGPGGKNGLSTMREKFLAREAISARSALQIGPTYAMDAARAIVQAATRGLSGTLHIAPTGGTTAFEFAREMAKKLGRYDLSIFPEVVRRQNLDGEPLNGIAYRPEMGLIKSVLAGARGLASLGTWQEGLARYLKDIDGWEGP